MGRGAGWSEAEWAVLREQWSLGENAAKIQEKLPHRPVSSIRKALIRLKRGQPRRSAAARWGQRTMKITQAAVQRAQEVLVRSPKISIRGLGREVGLTRPTAYRLMRNHLQLKPLRLVVSQRLTHKNKAARLAFCKMMLTRLSLKRCHLRGKGPQPLDLSQIIFTDEKLFRCENAPVPQNQRLWVDADVKRGRWSQGRGPWESVR